MLLYQRLVRALYLRSYFELIDWSAIYLSERPVSTGHAMKDYSNCEGELLQTYGRVEIFFDLYLAF